jgi:lysyl endopeptidase
MRKSSISLVMAASTALSAWGFAPLAGEPSRTPPGSGARALAVATAVTGPRLSLPALTAAKSVSDPTATDGAQLIGVARDAPAGAAATLSAIEWAPRADGGVVGRFSVRSAQAAALRVALALRGAPAGSILRFSGSPSIRAPLELRATGLPASFWSPVTAGDEQFVEIVLPEGSDPLQLRVSLEGVSHLLVDPSAAAPQVAGAKSAGSCQLDVACAPPSQAFLNAKRSVAKIVYTAGGATYACTGTLVNDADPTTQVPYMITAKHCIDSPAAAATVNTFWFLEASACGGKSSGEARQLAGGAQLLHAGAASDVALLRLNDAAPAGAWFSGIDGAALAQGEAAIALHHPAGDLKKVSNGVVVLAEPGRLPQVSWVSGSTEPGSSGSGLFTERNGQYVLRATLRGGSASCSNSGRMDDAANRDFYEGLQADLSAIQEYLNAGVRPVENYSDLWVAPAQPGTGISVTQHANSVTFIVWFSYDAAGRPTWLTMSAGKWISGTTIAGSVYRSQRPGAQVGTEPVGHATFNFDDSTHASLAFNVDGVTGNLALERYAF